MGRSFSGHSFEGDPSWQRTHGWVPQSERTVKGVTPIGDAQSKGIYARNTFTDDPQAGVTRSRDIPSGAHAPHPAVRLGLRMIAVNAGQEPPLCDDEHTESVSMREHRGAFRAERLLDEECVCQGYFKCDLPATST